MSQIGWVMPGIGAYFHHESEDCYVRILDTPHVWGSPLGKGIMPAATARAGAFENAVQEIVQKSRYRCDVASLNTPDPDWGRIIFRAMDLALSARLGRGKQGTQFRFLFGQTPLYPTSPPPNYTDFQSALVRLVRSRSEFWEVMPEIWMGRFYRLRAGLISSALAKIISPEIMSSDDTKMTWNHAKIIASDGAEALVGGHNLNMDLFTSYPPVHDVSVVVHGSAAYGAQLYLNEMWQCKTDLLTKECLDTGKLIWKNADDDGQRVRKPLDPLQNEDAQSYIEMRHKRFRVLHDAGPELADVDEHEQALELVHGPHDERETPAYDPQEIIADDLRTLSDIEADVFPERLQYGNYEALHEYKHATKILSVGKYWTGPSSSTDYQKASEIMKERLIKGARRSLRMSQMDLVSAWKKNWSAHSVCNWVLEALVENEALIVEVVVSPLDAGAGAEGDQYSFGSGAGRTFELMEYYMTHDVETDRLRGDAEARAKALERLHIAPFYFTDAGLPEEYPVEGQTYIWPGLSSKSFTATLKQAPLAQKKPKNGVIGSALLAVVNASGAFFDKAPCAPGNHSKLMIVDDESYVVGSDNLYPGFLSEFNYLIEGKATMAELLNSYWKELWRYSSPHCVNPSCRGARGR